MIIMLINILVQSFYEDLGDNLKQIATQSLSAVSGTEKCALQRTKSPRNPFWGNVEIPIILLEKSLLR